MLCIISKIQKKVQQQMDRLNSIRRDQRWRTSAHLSVTCQLLCQEMPALLKHTRQIAIVVLFCKGVVSSHISKATSVIEELRKTSTWHGNLRQLINLDPSRTILGWHGLCACGIVWFRFPPKRRRLPAAPGVLLGCSLMNTNEFQVVR